MGNLTNFEFKFLNVKRTFNFLEPDNKRYQANCNTFLHITTLNSYNTYYISETNYENMVGDPSVIFILEFSFLQFFKLL